ncbi:MAG: hypothetical protein HRU19_12900 [Pseudobacteriovorax sp.]|nr:hypothetical protein [Pseudobacteriovorax sp.]
MKMNVLSFLSIVLLSLLASSAMSQSLVLRPDLNIVRPDLVITGGQTSVISDTVVNGIAYHRVQVEIGFSNWGDGDAGEFLIEAEYRTRFGRMRTAQFWKFFQTSGLFTSVDGLAKGSSSFIFGHVLIQKSAVSDVTDIRFHIDTCRFDEFPKPYCLVNESNENNNTFTIFDVAIDQYIL